MSGAVQLREFAQDVPVYQPLRPHRECAIGIHCLHDRQQHQRDPGD
jgi:hypothetical protein